MTNSPFICPLPWIHLSTHPNGNVSICCKSNEPYIGLASQENELLNLNTSSLLDIINCETFRTIRIQMLNQQIPQACQNCFQEEQLNIESYRQRSLTQYPVSLEQLNRDTDHNGYITPALKYLELRISNKCNLKCITCNPGSSSLWAKELQANPSLELPHYSGLDTSPKQLFKWASQQTILDSIEQACSYPLHIDINGGEPTIINEHITLLKNFIQEGNAPKISLTYNINLTTLPDSLLELWKNFKDITIYSSIDAIEDQNEYIRFPSNWQTTITTLEKLFHSKYKIIILQTISIFNFTTLPQLSNFLQVNFPHIELNYNFVETPNYLSPYIIPSSLRKKVIKKLILQLPSHHCKIIYDKYFNEIYYSQGITKFYQYIDSIDSIRNTNWKLTFPTLANLLDSTS